MERILCAAIHKEGQINRAGQPLVYCGFRHNDILQLSTSVPRSPECQGFLTSTGRFVSRAAAYRIAVIANQLIDPENKQSHMLYSDDIY